MNEDNSKNEETNVSNVPNKRVTQRMRENPWILSTVVLGIISIIFVVSSLSAGGLTGNVVSGDVVGERLVNHLASAGYEGFEIVGVEEENGVYLILLTFEGQNIPFYVTKMGGYVIGNDLVSVMDDLPESSDSGSVSKESMAECAEDYGITSEEIIFYYSDSCGWCAKMKPGVEELEGEGYNFKWIESSSSEASEIVGNCLQDYMNSQGVPQFMCVNSGEIKVGAFVDENKDLDLDALRNWTDACLSN